MDKNTVLNAIDTFTIPDELAKELSELLIKQSIRETLLTNIINSGNMSNYDVAEKNLMDVTTRVDTIRKIITRDHVPEKYRSPRYFWNYDGYDIDGNVIHIYDNITE